MSNNLQGPATRAEDGQLRLAKRVHMLKARRFSWRLQSQQEAPERRSDGLIPLIGSKPGCDSGKRIGGGGGNILQGNK